MPTIPKSTTTVNTLTSARGTLLLPSVTSMSFADSQGTEIASWTRTHNAAYVAPTSRYVIIFAVTSAQRDGVARTVGVMVWWRNSVVTPSTPRTNTGRYEVAAPEKRSEERRVGKECRSR